MTDIVTKLAPQIWDRIQKSQNILLHCHPSPDGDSIGSALTLYHLLRGLNKHPTVIMGDSEPPRSLSYLPGFEQITVKNFFQIDLTGFDLFIIVDSSSLGQISKLGNINFPENLDTVVIDHHFSNHGFAKLNLVDTSYIATSQILYDLIKIWGITLTREIAACLFIGIYTDSGGFKYPLTNVETFIASAALIKIYPDFSKDIFIYENSLEPQQISYLALAFNSIEHFFSGKVAISMIHYSALSDLGIKKKHTEKMEVSNFLKSVIGWEIGITMTEIAPNEVNLSFRTRDEAKYNVAKIAQSTGFGGGHPAAAGAFLKMSYDQSKKLLLESIAKAYPDLGSP
jgi:phosphoesterase RecJ-like protein